MTIIRSEFTPRTFVLYLLHKFLNAKSHIPGALSTCTVGFLNLQTSFLRSLYHHLSKKYSTPITFLQLSRPMRRFWAARRGTCIHFEIIYEELVSWPAQAWGVGWGCLFLDFNTPSLPCGLHSTYHPLRPGSLQWTRCPNSQSDPGKLQPILPKPFEKKQIPSSSDINERDRRWPEDHRDAGPSDREVQFLVPKSTVQSETLDSDVEERSSVSFFLVQTKHLRLRGTKKTRCPWFSKFWEILSRRAPELETVLLS